MAPRKKAKMPKPAEQESLKTRSRKAHQPDNDELGVRDKAFTEFPQASPERHASLLSSVRSDGERARLVTRLQQSHGNAYVQRLVKSGTVQAKLNVSAPDDAYEKEADRVADTVQRQEEEEEMAMAKPVAGIQRQEELPEEELFTKLSADIQRQEGLEDEELLQGKAASDIQRQPMEEEEEELMAKPSSNIQRQEDEELLQGKAASDIQRQEGLEDEELLQGKAASDIQRQPMEEEEEELMAKPAASEAGIVSNSLEAQIDGARGSGQSLDAQTRASLEPRLGYDLSQVQIHTDSGADTLSRKLGAEAFTAGQDIFFREGAYQPQSGEGRKLITHELAHVVQQQAAPAIQRETATQDTAATATQRGFDAETAARMRHEIMTPIEQAAEEGLAASPPDIRKAVDLIAQAIVAISETRFEAGGFDEGTAASMRHEIMTPLEQAGEMLSSAISAPERATGLLSQAIVATSSLRLEASSG